MKHKSILFVSNFTALALAQETLSGLKKREMVDIFVTSEEWGKLFTKFNVICLPELKITVANSSPRFVLSKAKIFNEIFLKHFSKYRGCDVYFFNHVYWDFGLRIIKELSLNNKILFCNSFSLQEKEKSLMLPEIWLKYLFDLPYIKVIKNQGYFCPLITKKFISTFGIREFVPKVKIKKTNSIGQKKKVYLLAGGDIGQKGLNLKEYKKNFSKIIKILLKYYKPSEILITYHPRFIEDIQALTPYVDKKFEGIPAEMILNAETELLISTKSTSLGYNRSHLNRLKRISLIDLMYLDSEQKNTFKNSLLEMPTKIGFPQNLEEFEQIVKKR